MNHAHLTLHVRQLVHQALHRHGASADVEPQESILIQNGYYFGRRFFCDGLNALWLLEDNLIKVSDQEGNLLDEIQVRGLAGNESHVA
jgi:hypothetical protein